MVMSCVIPCVSGYCSGYYGLSQFSVRIILRPQYDDIIRRLAAAIEHQRTINEELRELNRQQVEINACLEITQARIEALLQRVARGSGNGRDA
jgi:hypothetical protein